MESHTHNLIWLYQWEIGAIDTQTLIGQPINIIRKPTITSNLRFYLVKKSRSLVCRSQKLRTDVSCTLAMVSRSHLSNYTHKLTLFAASNQRISGSSKPTNRPQIDTKLVLMRRKLIVEYLMIKEEDNVTLQSTQINGQRHGLSPLSSRTF